ncbi:MAG: DUF4417 domain-containing protein [Bacillota bacterium]|nr:DUF4417 domain-containing protein [Bacillota bacterium]
MKNKIIQTNSLEKAQPRNGCVDMWNAFMVKEAEFERGSDIPTCTCTDARVPLQLISYEDAKAIYKQKLYAGMPDFFVNAYIHFYIDDQKFDGKRSSIWLYPDKALEAIRHFAGIITPDFSTNADFPDPIKRYNTYRMRAFGCWMNQLGIPVINNVRWGTLETWSYCFDGIPQSGIVSIGTVASSIKLLSVRPNFEIGLFKMVKTLKPHTIIIYGSDKYPFFDKLKEEGINIIAFPSKTSEAFARRIVNE